MSAATPVLWTPGAAPARATRDRVDIWVIALDARAGESALRALCDAERSYAARLRVGAGAWVSARAALRRILGSYLGLAPEQVAIAAGAGGKPRIPPGGRTDLRFNLSHSGEVALVALRLGHEVGVDVEAIRSGVDTAAVARAFLPEREHEAMAVLATGNPGEAFFRAWARHEALAKASGRGIVSGPALDEAARYTVRDLDGIPGYAVAVASEGDGWSVRQLVAGESERDHPPGARLPAA